MGLNETVISEAAQRLPAVIQWDQERGLAEVTAIVNEAHEVRVRLRRRSHKGDPTRTKEITRTLRRLKRAMVWVRQEIARTYWQQAPDLAYRAKLFEISEYAQRERRKLWKMRQPTKHSDKPAEPHPLASLLKL